MRPRRCLGGQSEAPPGEGRIRPGSYAGEYGHIPDSLRQGFEAELILDRNGTYRVIRLQALQRLRAVSDTGFDLWDPGSLFVQAGWDHYSRESPPAPAVAP